MCGMEIAEGLEGARIQTLTVDVTCSSRTSLASQPYFFPRAEDVSGRFFRSLAGKIWLACETTVESDI